MYTDTQFLRPQETSREIQVSYLLLIAKEHNIEITKELYEFVVKRVYGNGFGEDMANMMTPMITAMSKNIEKKES